MNLKRMLSITLATLMVLTTIPSIALTAGASSSVISTGVEAKTGVLSYGNGNFSRAGGDTGNLFMSNPSYYDL